MRATSSVKIHRGRQPRTDGGYLEPILCPSLCSGSTSTRHHLSVSTPTPGRDGETPAKGLISGCKAGSAGLSMELTQEQRDYDREGEEMHLFQHSFIHSTSSCCLATIGQALCSFGTRAEASSFIHSFSLPSPYYCKKGRKWINTPILQMGKLKLRVRFGFAKFLFTTLPHVREGTQ